MPSTAKITVPTRKKPLKRAIGSKIHPTEN